MDIKLIREQPEVVRAALEKRHSAIALEPLLAMDEFGPMTTSPLSSHAIPD